jgi:hypothetical protein
MYSTIVLLECLLLAGFIDDEMKVYEKRVLCGLRCLLLLALTVNEE